MRFLPNSAVVLALALFCAIGATGQSSAPTSAPRDEKRRAHSAQESPALRDAEAALERKEFDAAEAKLKQLAAGEPQNYRAWFDLGYVYNATNRTELAVDAYRHSVAAQPGVLESNLNLGLLLASQGEAEAGKYLRAAEKLKPSPDQLALIARAWMGLGQRLAGKDQANAIDAYQQAARLSPKNAAPRFELGSLYERAGNYDAAEREFRSAAELEPESPNAMGALTNLYMRSKKYDFAEQQLRQILQREPQNEVAHLQLGRVLAAQQKHEEAIGEFEKALQLNAKDEDAMRELANSQMALNRYDQAITTLNILATNYPEDADVHSALASALLRKQNYAVAQQEYLKLVKLRPKSVEALSSLAVAASGNKQYPLCIQALDARAQLEPDTPGTYFLRATCYDHLGAPKEASDNYKQFLASANGKFPDEEWKARHRLIAIDPETRNKKR